VSWMAGNAGVGLQRRGQSAREGEAERNEAMDAQNTGGALRRELGAAAGVVAEKSGDVRECARAGPWRVRRGRN
jgi:hypothetical protein